MNSTQDNTLLPSIPCSRNLRRRTGIFLGLEAPELIAVGVAMLIPTLFQKIGFIERVPILLTLAIGTLGILFVWAFKQGKQPNYFVLWVRYHFLHPTGWRAPSSTRASQNPILNDEHL